MPQINLPNIKYDFDLKSTIAPPVIMLEHVCDEGVMAFELCITCNREKVQIDKDCTVNAVFVMDSKLLNDNVPGEVLDNGNIVVPIDCAAVSLRAGILSVEISVTGENQKLVPQYPFRFMAKNSVLETAEVTESSQGTVPELLTEAKEQLERVKSLKDGEKGDKGDDYVLTEQDKRDIAALAVDLIPTTEGVKF